MRIDRSYCSNQNTWPENHPQCIVVHIQTTLPPEPMPRTCKSAVPGKFSGYVGALLRR